MSELDLTNNGRVASKDWHPNACVVLNAIPPRESSFYGNVFKGPIRPSRSEEDQQRIKNIRRQLRGLHNK